MIEARLGNMVCKAIGWVYGDGRRQVKLPPWGSRSSATATLSTKWAPTRVWRGWSN